MVLALSLWVDYDANLLWLDGNFPTSANPSTPGVARYVFTILVFLLEELF